MVDYFSNKEREYEYWCKEHPNGFIFNHAGGSTGNVLHKVGCPHLNVPSRIGKYTTRYPKYCSVDKAKLEKEADGISKPYNWRPCRKCFG